MQDRLSAGPLPPKEAAELIRTIAEAVGFAHDKGIVHRDLKPGNILVDDDGNPRITDFGLAKNIASDSDVTTAGQVMGTPSYMPPEQAAGKPENIGPLSDVYSLGAMLYALLTGRPPFQAANALETLKQVQEREPVSPRELNPMVDRDLETICLKCVEKDSNRRYATACHLADELGRFLNREPITSRPVGRFERSWRWCRRYPARATVFVLLLLLGTAGPAAAVWLAQLNRASQQSAESAREAKNRAQRSAEDEKRAKVQAERRLAQVRRNIDIIAGIFADLDTRSLNRTSDSLQAVLAKRLIKAAGDLEGESIGDALAVAKLQTRLGVSLLNLGYPKAAISLFKKARHTFAAKDGPEHLNTVIAIENLAVAYRADGRLQEALPLLEQVARVKNAKLGANHRSSLRAMTSLANAYRASDRFAEAIRIHEETLDKKKAHLGSDDIEVLDSINDLAIAYRAAGQFQRALALYEEGARRTKAKLGANHYDTLMSMNNLASAYLRAKKLDKAIRLYEETLALKKANLGNEHPSTLATMNGLANALMYRRSLDRAIKLHEETLRIRRDTLGNGHPDTLSSLNNLAIAYGKAGKLNKALPMYEESLRLSKAKFGSAHSRTVVAMHNLGGAYFRIGKSELGLQLYEGIVRIRRTKLGSDHPTTLSSMMLLARRYCDAKLGDKAAPLFIEYFNHRRKRTKPNDTQFCRELGSAAAKLVSCNQYTDAEKLAREFLAMTQKVNPESPQPFFARSVLGAAILGQSRYAEAEQHLLAAYRGLKAIEKSPPQKALQLTAQRLVFLYSAWGKSAEAAKWRRKLKPARR